MEKSISFLHTAYKQSEIEIKNTIDSIIKNNLELPEGILVCFSPWGCKKSDITERLNWTKLNGSHKQTLPLRS